MSEIFEHSEFSTAFDIVEVQRIISVLIDGVDKLSLNDNEKSIVSSLISEMNLCMTLLFGDTTGFKDERMVASFRRGMMSKLETLNGRLEKVLPKTFIVLSSVVDES